MFRCPLILGNNIAELTLIMLFEDYKSFFFFALPEEWSTITDLSKSIIGDFWKTTSCKASDKYNQFQKPTYKFQFSYIHGFQFCVFETPPPYGISISLLWGEVWNYTLQSWTRISKERGSLIKTNPVHEWGCLCEKKYFFLTPPWDINILKINSPVYRGWLMISSQQEHVVGIFDLVCQ